MRVVYDLTTKEAEVCGGGNAYRNVRGFQGMYDMQATLTIIVPRTTEEEHSDVVEFHGSAKKIIEMLKQGLSAMEDTFEVCQQQSGPLRLTPCPNCDPLTDYPNATHTEECAFSKFWEEKRKKQA